MKLKLLLVQPSRLRPNGTVEKAGSLFVRNLTLPLLAALAPPDVAVEIVDDRVEDIDYDGPHDLVGITAYTSQAPRAYQIADRFRERGKKVVMGGIHATSLPEEAARHVDSVVIGEAENVWADAIGDARKGDLKPFYRSDRLIDMRNYPRPCWELLNGKRYALPLHPVQASRGCPHDCDFCSVPRFYGKGYRFRPVGDVVREIEASGRREIVFIDDNVTANRDYSKELFRALIPLRIRWIGQCTVNMGRDEELCRLAAESGCIFMGIGIESIDQDNLRGMDKGWNRVSDYPDLLGAIRRHGTGLVLNMIVGLDNDDRGSFGRISAFLAQYNPFYLILNTPIPYPGTRLYQRLDSEGRLLSRDWSDYVQGGVTFSPRMMNPECLKEGFWRILDDFYSLRSIAKRAFHQSSRNLPFYWRRNLELHRSVRKRVY